MAMIMVWLKTNLYDHPAWKIPQQYCLLDCDNTAICISDYSENRTYHVFKNIVSSDLLESCAW